MEDISYFLLDNKWYLLQNRFDNSLKEKYVGKLNSKFNEYEFVHKWNGQDETAYNKQYDRQPDSYFLHQIKVGHIEICDALLVDQKEKRTYVLHVKDGVGASIRDLTSQAYMSACIIEEESRTDKKDTLKGLYESAVNIGRIDSTRLSTEDFLRYFTKFRREYILVIHGENKSFSDIKNGNFQSRIAKHSLVEFASIMHVNDWDFSICCV